MADIFIEQSALPPGFTYPEQFRYLVGAGMTDFVGWHFISSPTATAILRQLAERGMVDHVPFAKCGASDDFACWNCASNKIDIVEVSSASVWIVTQSFDGFWSWFRHAIEDMIVKIEDEVEFG